MNERDLKIKQLTDKLASLSASLAAVTEPTVRVAINDAINGVKTELKALGVGESLPDALNRAAATRMPAALPTGANWDLFDVKVAIKAINGAAFSVLNDQFRLSTRMETLIGMTARKIGDERRQASPFQIAGNIYGKDPAEEMLEVQSQLESGLELLCSLYRDHEAVCARAVAEKIDLDLGQDGGRGFDAFPDTHQIYQGYQARSAKNRAQWAADREAAKAVAPSAYSMIG